jgi:hypothetical protein
MAAESAELENPGDAIAGDDSREKAEAFENSVRRSMTDFFKANPPQEGSDLEGMDPEEAADTLMDSGSGAGYNVLMTLQGHGVGVWDGRWDDHFPDGTDDIEKHMGKDADLTSRQYDLEAALEEDAFKSAAPERWAEEYDGGGEGGEEEEEMDPDAYREEHGKCPAGWHFDGKSCVKNEDNKDDEDTDESMEDEMPPAEDEMSEGMDDEEGDEEVSDEDEEFAASEEEEPEEEVEASVATAESYEPDRPHVPEAMDDDSEDDEDEDEDEEAPSDEEEAPSVSGSLRMAGVIAAANEREESPGKLNPKTRVWEGQVISTILPASEILEDLGQKSAAKFLEEPMDVIMNWGTDWTPDADDIAGYVSNKYEDAVLFFPEAAKRAWQNGWESGVESYMVTHMLDSLKELLSGSESVSYEGETDNGEYEVDVKVEVDFNGEGTRDVKSIWSDELIKITISNPTHLMNYADRYDHPVDEALDKREFDDGYSALITHLKDEYRQEIKNIGDVDSRNADFSEDVFDDAFPEYVEEWVQDDPEAVLEHLQAKAKEDDVSLQEVMTDMLDAYPPAKKFIGRLRAASGGAFDERQQKLPGM